MHPRNILTPCLLLLLLLPAPAQARQRDAQKEQQIWEQLRGDAPASVETFKRATEAFDANNHAEAARLYAEVLKAAPDFTPALRRGGYAVAVTGRREEGMALIEKAVKLERTPENLVSLAQALSVVTPHHKPSEAETERAFKLAVEADRISSSEEFYYPALVAQLALELRREAPFREAVATLERKFPGEIATYYFAAFLAAIDEDWAKAESEMLKAEAKGLPREAAEQFLNSGVRTRARVWRYVFWVLYAAAAWAVGLLALFVLGKVFSKKTMKTVEASDPEELTGARHETLRRSYRKLINFAGLYYYVSLPVVLCLVVLAVAAVFYAFMMAGSIPIKLMLILGVGALVTVYQMIRSFFVRHEEEDPGRPLREEEAPGLWWLAREVAAAVGTRPVDEIRVTPGTDLAVYERGSSAEKRQDRATRVLILGVGVLNGFSRNAFRAVLAHEYGHFSHRDTAGGEVALRVMRDMMTFGYAMGEAGQAVWYNLAFQFLRAYHFIFRRLSHGATRLQEMLADRVAVYLYGARAFEEGLTHVIYRGAEFRHLAVQEINAAGAARRALQNLYELPEAKGGEAERDVETAFRESLERKTSEDDTHPAPAERFRLARRVKSRDELPADGTVWELFADREALTREMSELVASNVQAA
ncbi:MAG TPA: M48 family metallopeptidase [Pyrinomonadaceae bacterium]|nr:M48 family metallopeptidase [Pyrinomonadaceae bacterium]